MAEWHLQPGDVVVRRELHKQFGGRWQGGISPSAQSPNVFCFTDPTTGNQHGYYDGWVESGLFQYTGEGQVGDQKLNDGNGAVLNHQREGRALHLFRSHSPKATYLGEFVVDEAQPYVLDDARATGSQELRKVIIFRLRPVGETIVSASDQLVLPQTPGLVSVAIEAHNTESYLVNPSQEPVEAERREQALVVKYSDWLGAKGHQVVRHQYVPVVGAKPLYSDLFDTDRQLLVEAKGSVTRSCVRMAIGQLADYSHLENGRVMTAVLLPERPRDDLVALLTSLRIGLIYPEGLGFTEVLPDIDG